jgi:hypothetical protein
VTRKTTVILHIGFPPNHKDRKWLKQYPGLAPLPPSSSARALERFGGRFRYGDAGASRSGEADHVRRGMGGQSSGTPKIFRLRQWLV